MYGIIVRPQARAEMSALRVYDHRQVVDAIRRNLLHEPSVPSRNRKKLMGASPAFEYDPPLWELRVGEYRVFYDVQEATRTVRVRAVRHKPPGRTTQEIIS